MNGLADLKMFSEIARSETMARAASRLGMAPATISGRLKALEDHYGMVLVRRTTRSFSLTEEGRLLLERAQPVLSGFADLEREMVGRRTVTEGDLVISCATDVGRHTVLTMVHAFATAHPKIRIDLRFDPPDSVREIHFDVALRAGQVRDSTLTIRKIFDLHTVAVASPAYLAGRGVPLAPADLTEHDCLRLAGSSHCGDVWAFGNVRVAIGGRLVSSDPDSLKRLCLQGLGIWRAARADVEAEIAEGRLQLLFPALYSPGVPIFLLSGQRKRLPARTVALINFARQFFRNNAPSDPGQDRQGCDAK